MDFEKQTIVVGIIGHIDHGVTTSTKEDLTNELLSQIENDFEQRRKVFQIEIPKVEYYNSKAHSNKNKFDFIAKRRR